MQAFVVDENAKPLSSATPTATPAAFFSDAQ
jgi:hypothetical protein